MIAVKFVPLVRAYRSVARRVMICDELSYAEVQEFITKVKSLPGCTDIKEEEAEKAAHLFLRARKRDVNRAVELFKANKRMRYTENVDSIDPLEDGVRKELLSGKFTVLQPNPDDSDELAATIAIFTAHRHWPPLTTHRDTLKGVLYQLDIAMLDEQSQRKGLIVLYDMRDTRYSNFDYHLCIKLLNLFKGAYPARLRKVIIVEAPFWFRAPFGVLRFFVKEKMRDRIFTVDLDELHVHLPPVLVERWFDQLTQHRHFDWLRTCLNKSGHEDRIPDNYFTSPPPVYRSLTQTGCDVLQCDRVSGLPSTESTASSNPTYTSLIATNLGYSGSLKYPIRTRRSSEDHSVSPSHGSLISEKTQNGTPDPFGTSVRTHMDRAQNCMLTSMYTVNDPTLLRQMSMNHGPSSATNQRSFRVSKSLRARSNNSNNNGVRRPDITPSPSIDSAQPNVTDENSPTRLAVPEFIERFRSLGTMGLVVEFEVMFKDRPLQGTCDRFALLENRRRNRYLDVPCLDATAVALSDGTYLHANWVHGYRRPRAYILAQGPLDNTRRDFWMAIWEYRVPVIVMLTKIVEGQRIKCSPYWPSKSSGILGDPQCNKKFDSNNTSEEVTASPMTATYGEFVVVNRGETIEAGGLYKRTRLELRRKSTKSPVSITDWRANPKVESLVQRSCIQHTGDSLMVDHLLYLGWPDFDVPSDPDGFLKFLDAVNRLIQSRSVTGSMSGASSQTESSVAIGTPEQTPSPVLIHCSAGIGRTGTFVTVDICMQQALKEGYIDVPDVITRLRSQRAGAVQVAKQYAFIHATLATQLSRLQNGTCVSPVGSS
ncbi:Protein-tyrosine phosphatase [Fasciola gigantica]|uniref:Protein-tyrosine phosphatase n=1 Tax=Fasciola gigantica TaxID=46835 RepID=A0A504Z3E9_FASGI|nr:Protein-tyrosine phosphatase [Fasciola gigantica]